MSTQTLWDEIYCCPYLQLLYWLERTWLIVSNRFLMLPNSSCFVYVIAKFSNHADCFSLLVSERCWSLMNQNLSASTYFRVFSLRIATIVYSLSLTKVSPVVSYFIVSTVVFISWVLLFLDEPVYIQLPFLLTESPKV